MHIEKVLYELLMKVDFLYIAEKGKANMKNFYNNFRMWFATDQFTTE